MKTHTKTIANGAIVDAKTGKIIQGPSKPPFCDPAVRQRALETRKRKRAMAAAGATRGIIAAANEAAPDIVARIAGRRGGKAIARPDDAVEAVAETLVTEVVLASDAPGAMRSRAWETICKQAELMPAGREDAEQQQRITVNMVLSDKAAGQMAEKLGDLMR
jgi:hypothetical protein